MVTEVPEWMECVLSVFVHTAVSSPARSTPGGSVPKKSSRSSLSTSSMSLTYLRALHTELDQSIRKTKILYGKTRKPPNSVLITVTAPVLLQERSMV